MKKTIAKKLNLRKELVRDLTTSQLEIAMGGRRLTCSFTDSDHSKDDTNYHPTCVISALCGSIIHFP